jgi:hypothetical protein
MNIVFKKCIEGIFEDVYLIAKITSLRMPKGIENDLRFLFERTYYDAEGKIPDTEAGKRIDLHLPSEIPCWIEIKCYKGILEELDTKWKIIQDLYKLFKINHENIRAFIYFGLYGKTQSPLMNSTYKPEERNKEIDSEISEIISLGSNEAITKTVKNIIDNKEKNKKEITSLELEIQGFSNSGGCINIKEYHSYKHQLSDRILYAAWFILE